MTEYAIKTNNLVKQFPKKRAVDGISLQVKRGEIYGILGPNGAGKTTFLRMLATLTKITDGQAEIFGYDVAKEASDVRRLIGLTGQYATVDEELTALENLVIFGRLNGLKKKDAQERALELLTQFSLMDAKDRAIKEFSGGMRRRLDLAVSLITKPPLIFLDEPTTGLDPITRGKMWDVIRQLVKEGSTILLTTQYLDEADQLADRIAIINHGKLVNEGTSNELKAQLGETYFEIQLEDTQEIDRTADFLQTKVSDPIMRLPDRGSLAIKINDTKAMTQLLVDLGTQGIDVKEFSVRKPTLDEVFLELTNR
ncbi:ATP-binding cassette domain-containing protein [Enterococcus hulanensis]|uniref:ATP-binding cassette domain-containing protein n=1 Tax=Enterococcus hulanensis TaxID=2559929 RepID=UPI0010F7FD60|nr:ATP-binding cassette domain-containing protein [Enterococcus hulanensis]MBO0455351.1 ATP-binding cassette domain-containing protein [Enterococcus hulanensis]